MQQLRKGALGGFINGRANIRGGYNWERKSDSKQALVMLIKIRSYILVFCKASGKTEPSQHGMASIPADRDQAHLL